ncbi:MULTISPECIES: DUF3721 domain-containing protein [Prochlorococcus]|uniref:Protein family PM-24 n=2 Tax=Prochlorococcus marinus TaxID=1219 RepID=Q7VAG8_PROMA|nr:MULTISPECIES: DUF3721 domain-containing protein [Prochlorococcus]AAQ00539.1 Predicted protein family PM-24 [Prochlorococcus marinus subsp. marinus str. CCMP1375]
METSLRLVMARFLFIPLLFTSTLLISCSTHTNKSKTRALFDTKTEAAEAAKDFNCTGAHKMGDKWMPCEKHPNHGHHNH